MTSLKTVLAATDLSSNSAAALDRGALIAKAAGARYDVVHATGRGLTEALREFLGENVEAISGRLVEKAREQLIKAASEACGASEIGVSVHVKTGSAAEAIPACAESLCSDLIVLGAHGRGFLSRLSLGSTASRVISKSGGRPVLIVKERPRHAYERVLVAVDFSPILETAIGLARLAAPGAHIVLLHVFDDPLFEETMEHFIDSDFIASKYKERATAELHEIAKSAGLPPSEYTALVVRGEAKREIVAEEEMLECDLVILGKHGSHVTEELLLGSVANGVLTDSQRDVLIVVDERMPPIWSYPNKRGATTRLLRPDQFDVSSWSAGAADPLASIIAGATGEAIAKALRDAFTRDNACLFEFGATILDPDIEARPTDLVMTLPFEKTSEAWQGPLLVISLENIVQGHIDALDIGDGGFPDPEGMAKLRDGLHVLANRIKVALVRNARKIDKHEEHKAPLW